MKAYSFLNTTVLVGPVGGTGVPLSGWAEGDDVIKIMRSADAATHKVGADGRMAIAVSADRSGEISFKLMQTGGGNKYLKQLLDTMEAGTNFFIPISVAFVDTYRNDAAAGTAGYIKKVPEVNRGAGINDQEWTIVVERLDILLGDPLFAGFATVGSESL